MKATRDDRKQRRAAQQAAAAVQPAASSPHRGRHAMLLLALVLVTALAYSNSFRSGFVVDNRVMLLDARIHAFTAENLRLILTKEYWYSLAGSGLYRPLSTFSYLCNFVVLGDGEQPAGYHWINLLLHVANVALVYALGLRLFRKIEPALAMAAVWGLHPLLTESVTNIIGRSDLLSAFGVLAGLLSYEMAVAASGRRKAAWLAAVLTASAIAVFSKESGIVLLGLAPFYDLARRQPASWRARAPAWAALLIPVCAFLYARWLVLAPTPGMHIGFGDNPEASAGFWISRITAIKVIGKYFALLLWPARLSSDYSYNQVPLIAWPPHTWQDWQAFAALLAIVAALSAAWISFRRGRQVFFFVTLFFITLAPASNLVVVIGSIMAERFLYLPAVGFAGCLVIAVYMACERLQLAGSAARWAPPAALGAICLVFAVRTYARNDDWRDDLSLWSSAVKAAPASYKTHMALASALVTPATPRLDEAIAEIEKAYAIVNGLPDELNNPAPYIDGASYYGQKGESLSHRNPDGSFAPSPQATEWYRKALSTLLTARRIEAANNRENRRLAQLRGRPYRDNGWYELYLELAAVHLRLGEPRKALEALEYGGRFKPAAEFFEKKADAHGALGDSRRAAIDLAAAILMDPRDARLGARLAWHYQRTDPSSCALRSGGQGLNTDCPLVRDDFCTASADVAALYQQAGLGAIAEDSRRRVAREFHCGPASSRPPL